MKQVIPGIPNLDGIIGVGFVCPSWVLSTGVIGTGNTTSTLQIFSNAAKEHEICMYITAMSELVVLANNFLLKLNLNNISLMDKGNVKYLLFNPVHIKENTLAIMREIERNIKIIKPDRILIDLVNMLTIWMDKSEKRAFYYDFFYKNKNKFTVV